MFFKLLIFSFAIVSQSIACAPQKLITYNIRQDTKGDTGVRDWQQRRPNVIKFLEEQKASVVGMQEVRVNQLKDLLKALPHYASIGVGREDGKTKGEYSPIFYDKSVWGIDVKQSGTFWLSDTPEVPNSKSWGNKTTRICTWVRLINKAGKGLYIYNTHWDHISAKSREKSAKAILNAIKQRANKDEPYILMGDLNTTTERTALKTLLGDGFLIDPSKQQVMTSNLWKAEIKDGLRIDHIFVSPGLKKSDVKVVATGNPPASDHHPVVMNVNLGAMTE